jgi:large subunit ribosomal protein L13
VKKARVIFRDRPAKSDRDNETGRRGQKNSGSINLSMKTYSATPTDIDRQWYIVDAEGMVLGRLASEIAKIIRGKHKPMYTPHMDTGDFVIVINASKVQVTGRKAEQKTYFSHTGYMGHEKHTPYASVMASHPERIIEKAVYGMLPKTALGRQVLRRKLRVYPGADHPHVAQTPSALTFSNAEASK